MGQEESIPQSSFQHIQHLMLKLQNNHPPNRPGNYSNDKKQPMCNCQTRKSLSLRKQSLRKQKRRKIFEESLPFSLPLVSNHKPFKNPSINEEEFNIASPKKKENNLFQQSELKNSFYIYEEKKSKVRPIRRRQKISDENQNPNQFRQTLKGTNKVEKPKSLKKTVGGILTKRGFSCDPNVQIQFEESYHQKITLNLTKMNHSIINQWYEKSPIDERCRSEKEENLRRRSDSKKTKIAKVEKATGIYKKQAQRLNQGEKPGGMENETLINITNVALLQSRYI